MPRAKTLSAFRAKQSSLRYAACPPPIPASSGKTDRHKLNRGGNRQANKAIHMIAVSRLRGDERTLSYMAKRKSDGKTKREAMRRLKRFIAREIHSTLRHPMRLKYVQGEDLAAMKNRSA